MDISKNGIEYDFGNGNVLKLSPLGPSDFHACTNHFNNQKMLNAISVIEKSGTVLSVEDKMKIVDNYMDKKYTEKQLRGLLSEMASVCFLLWRSAKRNKSDIQIADIENMIVNMEDVIGILLKLMAPPSNFQKPEANQAAPASDAK